LSQGPFFLPDQRVIFIQNRVLAIRMHFSLNASFLMYFDLAKEMNLNFYKIYLGLAEILPPPQLAILGPTGPNGKSAPGATRGMKCQMI